MRFDDEGVGQRLQTALNNDERFAKAARWFDGSVLLQSDDTVVWLKIYNGRVIDTMPFTPPLGYTFKIAGGADAWGDLVAGRRTFADLKTPGVRHFDNDSSLSTLGLMQVALSVEGNAMEANRLTETQYLIAEHLPAAAAGTE